MHILIINDDGPPSNASSPYVHSLVKTLQEAGHLVSVCLPNEQRSWIGKAHIIGKTLKPTYFRPGTLHEDDGTTHSRPSPAGAIEEWVLIDGTPASCAQIGIYHLFKDRPPVDLVVSGPNYGRNSTAVFGLSSGTLGGTLEAAVCKKRAVALSYAFNTRVHNPVHIAAASRLSTKLIEHLYENWSKDADLYTINVPLVDDVENRKVMWTNMLQNYWGPTSCFEETEDNSINAEEAEQEIRRRESDSGTSTPTTSHSHKHFKWAPKFQDVHKSVAESLPGNDGWAVGEGYTSVTPLKANFMHAALGTEGELKLQFSPSTALGDLSIQDHERPAFVAQIEYGDSYVQPLILRALKAGLPKGSYIIKSASTNTVNAENLPQLHIKQYEDLPFEDIMHSSTILVNSYIIRKALIRKHYLNTTVQNHIVKNPASILKTNVKPSCEFELDYAEFLDDALVEAWELNDSLEKNELLEPGSREYWILKPGMSDRGQGIRLFSTREHLQSIFEDWEADLPDTDDDDEDAGNAGDKTDGDYIMTSQLRHFIAQPYIDKPLLLVHEQQKFHIRTYVLAVGALRVYVYKPMLALFASKPYAPPGSSEELDLQAHLTNTCLQDGMRDGAVRLFWDLPGSTTSTSLPVDWKMHAFEQICDVTGEIFEAAAKGMTIHFQTLPNAFELFGLDFLVDERGIAWLLEVNAFPDFKQTGDELMGVVSGLWEGVVDVAIKPFFGLSRGERDDGLRGGGACESMVLVKSLDLGRR